MRFALCLGSLTAFASLVAADPYNTFDGPGFPTCHNVAEVYNATSVDDMVSHLKDAIAAGKPVRTSGKSHMWYDTMCSDDPNTVIVRTEFVNQISDLELAPGAESGSVMVDAGVTFLQLADWLHERNASMGYTLVNWNITLAGAVAMGAHRSSLKEDSMVAAGALEIHVLDGNGNLQVIQPDDADDTWLAATTSLGLLGAIVRLKFKVYPDFKVYAKQEILDEDAVLNGDIYGMISPYATANFWWWPFIRKFHYRYYDPIPTNMSDQQGFQSTFSVTPAEAGSAVALLNSGKYLQASNEAAESLFFGIWSAPNFHDKVTNLPILTWPVYGWNYDVLIGGLYPGYETEWDGGLHGYTFEMAFPVTMANKVLQRIRAMFDYEKSANGKTVTATYRSGINIKFGKPFYNLLGQTTVNTSDGADWSKGAIMFDFPSFRPSIGDHLRYDEPFYANLTQTLLQEFPCRPHWTKNTREVFQQSVKNLDPDHLKRFAAVRQKFDPKGVFKSVVGEIIGVMGNNSTVNNSTLETRRA